MSVYRDTMSEPETASPVEEMPSIPITFLSREMYVTMPTPTQLAVWKRVLVRLQTTPENSWTAEAVVDSLGRLVTIIETLLVEPVDKAWLEDSLLDGTLDFPRLAPFITLVTEAFQAAAGGDNRASKRAAKRAPAKKAGLKAPAKRRAS